MRLIRQCSSRIQVTIRASSDTGIDVARPALAGAPTISRHLSLLEDAGLVSSERQGQRVLYRLNRDTLVNTLTGFAFEICPVGGPLKRKSRRRAAAGKAKGRK